MPDGVVVVAGATGAVGEGITAALLAAGHRVVAVSRSAERVATLRSRLGVDADRLQAAVGDLGTPDTARAVTAGLTGQPVEAVVVSVGGGWRQGPPLVEVSLEEWRAVLDAGLTVHLVAAQALLPLVRAGGAYVAVNGSAALEPVVGAGPISVAAAAQLALARALAAEHPDTRVRSLLLMTPVISRRRPEGPEGWLTTEQVGAATVALLAGRWPDHDDVAVQLHPGAAPAT